MTQTLKLQICLCSSDIEELHLVLLPTFCLRTTRESLKLLGLDCTSQVEL